MDKRKFMFKSLHKNLQLEKQSSEMINSTNNEQIDLNTINIMQDGNHSFNDGQLSNIESSELNSLNLSLIGNNSTENKKKGSSKNEKDLLERNNSIVMYKLSKSQTSISMKNSTLVNDIPSITSQQSSNHLTRNEILVTSKPLTVVNPSIKEKPVSKKRKISSSTTDSDSDLESSSNKYIKKKHDKVTINTKKHNNGQNNNTNSSSKKLVFLNHASSTKPVMVSNIPQKELQDKPSVLINFLEKCGIMVAADGICILNVSPSIAKQKIKTVLNSKQYKKKDIIDSIKEYVQDKHLLNILNNIEVSFDNRDFTVVSSVSLARILLEVTEIQTDVYNIFISKLNESVLCVDTPGKVPWAVPVLHQFRFLDTIVDVDTLTANIEQLLETCPTWFQHELILFLPDILLDSQHQSITEVLIKIMEENSELTNVILNCIASFNLNKECLMEYKVKVLNLLKTNIKLQLIPSIIRFLLNDYVSPDIVKQMFRILRDIEMQPLAGDEVDNCYKNQVQIVRTLKLCMLLNKDVTHAAIMVVKDINKNPKPFDLIILLLIFTGTIRQKNAESLWKQNVRCGFYRTSLLLMLYNDYKEVVQELQLSTLQLAGRLIKSDERVFVNFAIEWFRLQFLNQKEMLFKQREIIEKIILLMGNNDQTVKHALIVLCKMAENTIERNCLVLQCNHLRILLEKIDCFGLQEVGTLNDLLHSLCLIDDSTSESLRDDLFILLQKQLSSAKPLTKCKGVMGTVMAIKHLAGKAETCDQAMKLFNKVMKCVRSCSKSQPLFYDQLAQIIAQTEFINTNFVKKISNCIEDEFVNTYMTDKLQSSEHLVPKFGLNNAEEEPQNCVLNLGNKKNGPIAPILFRLLKTCYVRLNAHGELEAIDALLGCALLMPQNFDIPEPSILDLLICCINWFREIITGFVTQKDLLLRKQVLERLDTLMYLQSELDTLLTLCDTKYQPPPCYFHYFPLPLFIKAEKKCSKKGKKFKKENKSNASIAMENDLWKTGSTLCYKNPAYFRQFDAKIAHLLDIKIDVPSSQHTIQTISIKQVCFLVRELLAIYENEPSESFVKELIHLLPKVCSKLDDIVARLRQDNNYSFKEGARLLLCLLTTIFNWKGFVSVTYNTLLREGLRTLAGRVNEENIHLRSCKELVAESYKYFESLSDIATEISLATALVNMCQSLMKHSESYVQQYKDKHAKLAYGFLCLEWPENKHIASQYKLSVIQLLDNWIDNEPSPLRTVTLILEWLPKEVSNFENVQSTLIMMPSINKNIFHLLYKRLFAGLIKGINISLLAANSDPKRIKIWYIIASNVQKLVHICKTLTTKANKQLFLQYMPQLIRQFLNFGMPILEHNLKYQTNDVTDILKMMQGGTRYLHAVCCDCIEKKDLILTKYVPVAKSILEKLIYSVKGMLVLNDSAAAFWMGNLVNKNLDGHEILSQTSSEETVVPVNIISEELTNASSEIIDSDLDEDPTEHVENENTDIDDM